MAFKSIKINGNGAAQTVLTNTSILEGVTTGLIAYNSTGGSLSFSLLLDTTTIITEAVGANSSYRLPDKVNVPVSKTLKLNAPSGLNVTISAYQSAIDPSAALTAAQTAASAAAQSALDAANALPAGAIDDSTAATDKVYSSTKVVTELALKEASDSTILKDADIGSTVQAFDSTILKDADIGSTVQAFDATIVVNADIGTTVQAYDVDTSKTDVAETRSASINMADNVLQRPELKDYSETKVSMGANDVDLSAGNVFTKTISGATTLTFSNPPTTGKAGAFTLILTNGGSATITWPTSVDWAAATAPVLTAAGVDVLTFTTIDGGTIWYGIASGIGMG